MRYLKQMTRSQHSVNKVPFLGIGLIAMIVGISLVDIAAAVGWLLSLLEIQSVYDRLLPGWTPTNYFLTSVAATIVVKLLAKGLPS